MLGSPKHGICSNCKESDVLLVYRRTNERNCLCVKCNEDRKRQNYANKRMGVRPISKRGALTIKEDERIYKILWDSRPHRCEECGEKLGDVFREANGKVINRYRYSHILPKSTHPEFRHLLINFNLLCLKCHNQWEDRHRQKSMKIYTKNKRIIERLLHGEGKK